MFREAKVERDAWRKSSQFVGLLRGHAELVAHEQQIDATFSKWCRSTENDPWLLTGHHCVSDEHFVPTILSHHGLSHESDCGGFLVHVEWPEHDAQHPRAYQSDEITAGLVHRLRRRGHCNDVDAIELAERRFADIASSALVPLWSEGLLGPHCPYFARKFPEQAASAVLSVFTDCDYGLSILQCRPRHADT